MIGVADWYVDAVQGSGLRVRQLMMSTMAAESAMLDLFRTWLTPRTVLSSYNGRCYDAPLLKTRYRLARRGDPIAALDHVDLLFPTRRRYRGTWENCKLSTIERQLLRVVREDDLPGSEAPAAWLSYLRGGSARNLRRVAEHNHQDVVTLSLLMQRLVALEAEERHALTLARTLDGVMRLRCVAGAGQDVGLTDPIQHARRMLPATGERPPIHWLRHVEPRCAFTETECCSGKHATQ